MSAAPVISSLGPPPEKHCVRIIGEMLAFLHQRRMRLQPGLTNALDPKRMGNPVSQMRQFERFKRLAGETALDLQITTAKRGRFTMSFTEWALYHDQKVVETNSLPLGASLAAVTSTFRAANYVSKEHSAALLAASRHSLERLAERGAVRTVDQMVICIGSLWNATMALMLAPDSDTWRNPPHGAWVIPVGGGYAVLKPHRDGLGQLVVVSVLAPEMANEAAARATMAVMAPRLRTSNVELAEPAPAAKRPPAGLPEAPGGCS